MNVTLKLLGGPQDGFEFHGDPAELAVRYLDPIRDEIHTYVRGNGRTYTYHKSESAAAEAIGRFEAARDAANETDARYNE